MGLNFAIQREQLIDAQWSYGGFNDFRRRLAQGIGIELDAMERHGGHIPWSGVDDPIVPLLDHSDCDGELDADVCRTVAPRLRELVSGWDSNDYDRESAEFLADAMDEIAANDLVLVFT